MRLIRLALDLLVRRQPGEPVPPLVPLASWNPDGPSLPVLDGLDEVRAAAAPGR
ncbi:hypothetical protein [Frankia sp. R82]|uniref:hypothetical protein n=1 Tax=Frankia sp. R82 TaxID=2950553 RepID=UPI00204451BD|nr:hypothetical protein [Frankia sp. R82]MCM3887083.1 hypothetical protein [Frankia sp. R82]